MGLSEYSAQFYRDMLRTGPYAFLIHGKMYTFRRWERWLMRHGWIPRRVRVAMAAESFALDSKIGHIAMWDRVLSKEEIARLADLQ